MGFLDTLLSPSGILTILFVLAIIFGALMYGGVKIQQDQKGEQISQMQFMGILTFVIVLLFAYISQQYINKNPDLAQGHLQLLVYLSLFISLMSMSVSTTQKINS
jgi:hypothetical protein